MPENENGTIITQVENRFFFPVALIYSLFIFWVWESLTSRLAGFRKWKFPNRPITTIVVEFSESWVELSYLSYWFYFIFRCIYKKILYLFWNQFLLKYNLLIANFSRFLNSFQYAKNYIRCYFSFSNIPSFCGDYKTFVLIIHFLHLRIRFYLSYPYIHLL